MTRFTQVAIAVLLAASSVAISKASTANELTPDTKIVLPHDVQSFLQPAAQEFVPRSMCLDSCQSSHSSCLSSARSDDAKAACEKQFTACTSACPMNKS
jgi:hypothetical protein